MNQYFIYSILACLLMVSCGKDSDLDFDQSDDYKQIDSDTVAIRADTVGIHPLLGDKYIVITAKEQRLLYYAGINNKFSLKPVSLPESDNISKDLYPEDIQNVMFDCSNNNSFYGYPAAIDMNGTPLIVFEKRVSERSTNDYSDGVFLTSANGIWKQTDFFKYAPYGNGFLSSRPLIAKTNDGRIVVKSEVGVLISAGDPDHWTHYPHAFDVLNSNGEEYGSLGNNMAYSPGLGVFFGTGHIKMSSKTLPGTIFGVNLTTGEVTEVKKDWIPPIIRNGISSEIQEIGGPVFFVVDKNKDPDLAAYDGSIIGFAVNKDKVYQFVYRHKDGDSWNDVRFVASQTSIQGSLSRQSNPGIIYNPVMKQFEMIHSSPYELDLYSIPADSLLKSAVNAYGRAEWKKEVVLLERNLTVRAQGMNPISSIVDLDNMVQRIFIDAGDEYPGRSGIFEITRTLKTNELSTYVTKKRAFIKGQLY